MEIGRHDQVTSLFPARSITGRAVHRLGALSLAVILLAGCGRGADSPSSAKLPPPTHTPTHTPIATPSDTPTATLPPTPTPMAASSGEVIGVPETAPLSGVAAELDDRIERLVQAGEFSGAVLIAQDGAVLLNKGYGLADRETHLSNEPWTRFRIASLTKQFTALAILILHSQGLLHVDDPICAHVADCPSIWQGITIHQLLTHTAGIPDFTRFDDYEATKATPSPLQDTLDRFRDRPLEFPPGTRWEYSNSGYVLLGEIIERVSGQSYAAYLQEQIFDPLDMTQTGYDDGGDRAIGYRNDSAPADEIDMSIPHAAGGLVSTVNDLYLWDQALYADVLVPQELMAQMFFAHASIPNSGGAGYGYGWVIEQVEGQTMVGHNGGIEGFVAGISRFPDARTTVIFLSNQQNVNPRRLGGMLASRLLERE